MAENKSLLFSPGEIYNMYDQSGALNNPPVEEEKKEDPLFKYKVFQNLSQPAPDLGGKK